MALETLMSALDRLDGSLTVLEKAVTKIEQRPKTSGRGKSNNQLDMFGMPTAPMPAAVNNVDVDDVSRRLARVIAQIETVLGDAA